MFRSPMASLSVLEEACASPSTVMWQWRFGELVGENNDKQYKLSVSEATNIRKVNIKFLRKASQS